MAQVKALIGNIKGKDGSENQIYSTDEQVVGKWIDGRPIYRRVFQIDRTISHGQDVPITNQIPNIDSSCIIRMDGFVKEEEGGYYASYMGRGTDAYGFTIYKDGKEFRFYNYSEVLLYIGYLIAEYTKTTDIPTT